MKKLYLIRHAKSSWDNLLLEDIKRPLNARGKRDAPFMAKFMKKKINLPALIVSSPAKRALSTAKKFSKQMEIKLNQDERLYFSGAHNIFKIISETPEKYESLLLFGHNPTITAMVNSFDGNSLANLPTAGIAEISLDIDSWNSFTPGEGNIQKVYFPKELIKKH